MKKILSVISGAILIIAVILTCFILNKSSTKAQVKDVILKVWHIDTFEGGVGSRYNFLRSESANFSKKNKGVYFLVVNHTIDSAKNLISQGKVPDLISYGNCGIDFGGIAREIKFDVLDGGKVGLKRFAVSYLRGGYFLIKKGSGENLILSKNTYTTPEIACLFTKIQKDFVIKQPLDAYTHFLQKKDATLLGTQRDIFRLRSRGVDFQATPITEYSDLYQYLSITTKDDDKEIYAQKFIEHLLSDKVQQKVKNLGLFSVTNTRLYSDDEVFSSFESSSVLYTLSPFVDDGVFSSLIDSAKEGIKSGKNTNSILKFLKQL